MSDTVVELVPAAPQTEVAAVAAAIGRAQLELAPVPEAYTSPWRLASLAEGAERAAAPPTATGSDAYALSPRRTRGATRA